MDTLDQTDQKLISLLRSNARMPVVELAKKLRVSRATVQNRMARLEKERVLLGYTVKLRADVEEAPIRALMSLAAENKKETVAAISSGFPARPTGTARAMLASSVSENTTFSPSARQRR